MRILTTTLARKQLSQLINLVRFRDEVIAIGRRNEPEVLLIRYPQFQNKSLSAETNINANSETFGFLREEPDLYTLADLKKSYV